MGLAKANRLKHRKDFQAVYQQGIACYTSTLILRGLHQEGEQLPSRLGIVVSLKVSKKAVVRNRLKRQLRVAFRGMLPRIAPGWLIVIIVRSKAVECESEHFLRQLEQLLKKAGIIHGN